MKIETLNPEVAQSKAIARESRAIVETPRRGVSTVPGMKIGDSLNLSVSFPSAGKNLSVLLSSLIEMLNIPDVGAGLKPAPTNSHAGAIHELPLLDSLFYKGEEPVSFLKNFIENSGLLYEAKIARGDIKGSEEDLKGLLLRIVEKSEIAEAGFKPAPTVNALLNDIETKQLLNARGKEEGAFYLQIPVSLPQGPSTAEVYIRRDGKGKGNYSGDSYRIGFSMETEAGGLVNIDALVRRDSVSVKLQAEKAEFLEFLESQLPEFKERLYGYGMRFILRE